MVLAPLGVHSAVEECRDGSGQQKTAGEVAKILVAHVVAAELSAEFKSVIAEGFREVVADLILRDVATLREEGIACAARRCSADVEPGNVGGAEIDRRWKPGQCGGAVGVVENSAIPLPAYNELVHQSRVERVGLVDLALPL